MITRKDHQFMKQVITNARIFSTCVRRQYFALLVDQYGHTIGTGYNGVPKHMTHCDRGGCPRAQTDVPHGSPYDNCLAIHAEVNAIIHSDYSARRDGCTLYVNGRPCWDCAKVIANSGVTRIVYLEDDPQAFMGKADTLLTQAGIEIERLDDLIP